MPQMMPMYWIYLHIYVILFYFLTINLIYFISYSTLTPSNHSYKKSFYWNWMW